jgi:putative Holliday junction resolvase
MGRVLAIDLGEQRVGLALSDPTRTIASSLPTLRRSSREQEFAAIRDLVAREEVEEIIVGLPIGMSGSPGVQAELTRRWTVALRQAVAIPVRELDERLTSVQAQRTLDSLGVRRRAQRSQVDAVAATLLLQTYLEQSRSAVKG